MPQPIKPRECKHCRKCRSGKPGMVRIIKYTVNGEVYETGRCDNCSMPYTPQEMLELRKVEG
jgi:NADH:ubiquinone oxidoreductase subunit F (NADH-binding)